MNPKVMYEKRILKELQNLPDKKMPKLLKLIHNLKKEILNKKSIRKIKEPFRQAF